MDVKLPTQLVHNISSFKLLSYSFTICSLTKIKNFNINPANFLDDFNGFAFHKALTSSDKAKYILMQL